MSGCVLVTPAGLMACLVSVLNIPWFCGYKNVTQCWILAWKKTKSWGCCQAGIPQERQGDGGHEKKDWWGKCQPLRITNLKDMRNCQLYEELTTTARGKWTKSSSLCIIIIIIFAALRLNGLVVPDLCADLIFFCIFSCIGAFLLCSLSVLICCIIHFDNSAFAWERFSPVTYLIPAVCANFLSAFLKTFLLADTNLVIQICHLPIIFFSAFGTCKNLRMEVILASSQVCFGFFYEHRWIWGFCVLFGPVE